MVSAIVGAGGTLAFNIDNAGSGYVNPRITIEEPIYENMSVIGVSRLGQGATTETGENLLLLKSWRCFNKRWNWIYLVPGRIL